MKQISREEVESLMSQCQIGFGGHNALDNAHACLAECHSVLGLLLQEREDLLKKIPKASTGKWTMTRLWRSWMASTAEYMAGQGAIMPLVVSKDGAYKKTRPFNQEDAHELFTAHWLGHDSDGNRFSWSKSKKDGPVADKGQRFHAMQKHEQWMIERGIKHINPRESEFAQLLAMADGMNV